MTSKEKRIINSLTPKDWNKDKEQAKQNETFILPNVSGDHSKSIVRDTPTQNLSIANKKYVDDNSGGFPEGTAVKSTGETGGSKFLREDGDNSCSWQTVSASSPEGTAVLSTGEGGGTKFLREDGDGSCSWQADNNTTNHTALSNIGSNSHAQIDTHIADTSGDPHAIAADTLTLTNKTIDANGTGNSLSNVDVADLANGTDGQLITWDANASPTTVAVGTATHVLTSNGAGAAPTFQAAAGGSNYIEKLDSGVFAGTDTDITQKATSSIDATKMASNDVFWLVVTSDKNTGNKLNIQCRITENSVTHTGDQSDGSSEDGADLHNYYLWQGNTNTEMNSIAETPLGTTERQNQSSGHSADWITGALTFEIWARISTSGTFQCKWKLYRLVA